MAYALYAVQTVTFANNLAIPAGTTKTIATITSEMITAAQKGYITITDTVNSVALSLTGFGAGLGVSALSGSQPALNYLGSTPTAANELAIVTRLNMLEAIVAGILNATVIPTK